MYFVKITNQHSAKNRLQEYLSKQLSQLECLTVDNPDTFKKYLETTVHRANLKFPRCRPLVSYLHTAYASGGFTVGVSEIIQFSLYEQRGAFSGLLSDEPARSEGTQVAIFS